MEKNGMVFNTKRMPEKWRRHFKIYRAKVSLYLDTSDFGTPMMVDASEMMEFLPASVNEASFVEKIGPVRPGAEALWIEAEVPDGLSSKPNVRRIGAMIHRSVSRTSFKDKPFTGAEHEFWIEAYLRDQDGLSTRLDQDIRFRLDDRGFLTGLDFLMYWHGLRRPMILRNGTPNPFATDVDKAGSDNDDHLVPTPTTIETINRVFFAMALMNCRNVSLRERGSNRTTGTVPTGDAFHEVVIDGNVRASTGSKGGIQIAESTGRRHLSRGHFKTFTEEAPLLGKHVGTYWWGWQVRGQDESGVIEKSYTLKAPRS